MTRLPKPGDRLLPKDPTGSVVAIVNTTSSDSILTAPEVRITTLNNTPEGVAVAMWVGSEGNVCYVGISALDEDSYVFADEFDEILTTDINEIRSGDFVSADRLSRNSNCSVSGTVVRVETRNLVHRIYMKDSGFVFEVPTSRKAFYNIRRKKSTALKPDGVVIPKHEFLTADDDGYTYKAPIGVVSSDGTYVFADWRGPFWNVPCMSVEDVNMSSIEKSNE